eukprot:366328-Chlamydomonas_euryale.AAC.5
MDGASNAPPMPPLASGRLIARTLPDSNDRRGGWFSSYRATGLSDMEGAQHRMGTTHSARIGACKQTQQPTCTSRKTSKTSVATCCPRCAVLPVTSFLATSAFHFLFAQPSNSETDLAAVRAMTRCMSTSVVVLNFVLFCTICV